MLGFLKGFSLFIGLIGCLAATPCLIRGASLSPSLENLILTRSIRSADSLVSVIVFSENNEGNKSARKAASMPNASLQTKHRVAIEILQARNSAAVRSLKTEILRIYPAANPREYWIAPALSFKIPVAKLSALAELRGVAAVFEDAMVEFIEPIETVHSTAKVSTVHSHLTALNVPSLWSRGITGKGRLVCSFDTGVEGSHPALESKWRGKHASHSASWFAPSSSDTIPSDRTGHGTHTMGLMVGNADADSFGVAPDAEWISAAVIDQGQSLNRTISDILAAFEWAVDPDGDPSTIDDVPDVILNSWGVPTSIMEPCDETFYQVIDNVETAGIVTVFAAGNEGPNPQSLRLPANRATSPLNSFAVGAIDGSTDVVADFSSRGPSSCDITQIKPEVVAPGVGVYSCAKGGGYVLKSGTSMAAPQIAGLVALLRQYNPEATVNEIKNAIICSARDLGSPGEDNDYGYGLPDAEKALLYMPVPPIPAFLISDQLIGDDGIAEPGETFNFYVRLEAPAGDVDSVTAYLDCHEDGVDIINDYAVFIFEEKSTHSTNNRPYVISFDKGLINGRIIPFSLRVYIPFDTNCSVIDLEIMVGVAPDGNMVTHMTSKMRFTVTDFGQYGLGENSIYPAGGAGFKFMDSENLLYEAGIIVGRNALQLSSSVRDSLGHAYHSDFSLIQQISTAYPDIDGGFKSYSKYADAKAEIPIPITIGQSVSSYDEPGEDNYVLVKYHLINNSNESINGLHFGFLADFDLSEPGDQIGIFPDNDLFYQLGDYKAVGLLPLTSLNGLLSIENGEQKAPFANEAKYGYIAQNGININDSSSADFMVILSFGSFNIYPYDSVEIALALVAGQNLDELQASADRATQRYNTYTAVFERQSLLPKGFELHQNYPNPFNPSTTISFDIAKTVSVKVTILNIMGQEVATIFDDVAFPGEYHIIWNGKDNEGNIAASGVYFCRLRTDSACQTRKMMLIK